MFVYDASPPGMLTLLDESGKPFLQWTSAVKLFKIKSSHYCLYISKIKITDIHGDEDEVSTVSHYRIFVLSRCLVQSWLHAPSSYSSTEYHNLLGCVAVCERRLQEEETEFPSGLVDNTKSTHKTWHDGRPRQERDRAGLLGRSCTRARSRDYAP